MAGRERAGAGRSSLSRTAAAAAVEPSSPAVRRRVRSGRRSRPTSAPTGPGTSSSAPVDRLHERHGDVAAADGDLRRERRRRGGRVLGRARRVLTSSQALEQVGTSADCDSATGKPSYYAWYELVPGAAVTIQKLKIAPGDLITTSVNVVGGTTRGAPGEEPQPRTSFTTTLPFAEPRPDLRRVGRRGACELQPLPLQPDLALELRSVAVHEDRRAREHARRDTHREPRVDDDRHHADSRRRPRLLPGPDRFAPAAASTAGASPTAPSSDGRGFSVSWTATAGTS